MNGQNDFKVSSVAASKTEGTEPIASYSAAAAEAGTKIANPEDNYMTPARTAKTQTSARPYDANLGSMTGYMSAKAIFSQNMYNDTGLNMFSGSGATGYYSYNGGTGPNIFGDGTFLGQKLNIGA